MNPRFGLPFKNWLNRAREAWSTKDTSAPADPSLAEAGWLPSWKDLFAPKIPEAELDQRLQQIRAELPQPVIWLLGKTQSGKTSIIRGLTGSTRAEIGNGFRPCTRTAQLYAFPSDDDCLIRFLDTRGLGEAGYDPAEDLAYCQAQSHLLLVVVKSLDHALQPLLEPLKQIRRAAPQWPVIVAQTSLHEGYATLGASHLDPYPWGTKPLPDAVPNELSRSLTVQRQVIQTVAPAAQFVPLDFTLPEDGFTPENYGLEALWSAIEIALPLGLRGMLETSDALREPYRDACFHTAQAHLVSYSLAAGGAAAIPAPMVDLPLVLAIQGKMFHSLASIYGQRLTPQLLGELGGALGMGFLARLGGRELAKFVPGVGAAAAAMSTAISTYGLGYALCHYFARVHEGDLPDSAAIRELYQQGLEVGRQRLGEYWRRRGKGS